MKKINWLWAILLIIVGILIIASPESCVKFVSVILGLGAVVYGIYSLIESRKIFEDQSFYKKSNLVKSCVTILLGLLTVIFPMAVATSGWKIMVYIFAVYLILASAFGFYTISMLKDVISDRKRFNLENFTVLAAGVLLLLINPQKLGGIIIVIIGIVALVVGLLLLLIQIISFVKNRKNIIVADAKVVDEPAAESGNENPAENESDGAEKSETEN